MVAEGDLTTEDLEVFEAKQLVKSMSHADDLVDVVVDDNHHWAARNDAAEKLIEMWKDGRRGGINIDHLACVGDYAEEPYKSQANKIISDSI